MSDPNNPYSQSQNPPQGQPGFGGQPAYGYPQQPPPGQPGGAAGYGQTPAYGGYPPAPMPGQYTGDPNAPYGYDPYGRPYSEKSKIVAGLLQLFLGGLGIGRFYTGHVGIAVAQLFTCGGLGIWSLIDGIIMLTSNDATDSDGRVLRNGT